MNQYNETVMINPVGMIDPRNFESPRSIKVDIFDPLGRASMIEENLRAVFRKLNVKGVSCLFSIGLSQNKMYMDSFNDIILFVNDKYALTNKDRFRLDRPLNDSDLEGVADFFAATLETACSYRL